MNSASLSVPDPTLLGAVQRLCEYAKPYQYGREEEALFLAAMVENIGWHASRSEFYGNLLARKNFSLQSLKTVDDCANIPFIHANFFKTHEVVSVDRRDVAVHLTSSGTTGQKSQMFFDAWTIGAAHRMVDFIYREFGFIAPDLKTNYLLFNYETLPDSKLGTSYTAHYLCKYAPAKHIFYALRNTGTGTHEFDIFGAMEKLKSYEQEGLPVRIFGFPSFMYFTLRRMKDLSLPPLKLSPESLVMFGGGWKGHAREAIKKEDLYDMIRTQLGIPEERIRDGFGSVEHCVPYIECRDHNFHVPVWSRVFIRDVKTLEPLGFEQSGFLNFVSPYITSVPAQSVLMGDLTSLHDGKTCRCGTPTPYFIIHGRAGTTASKSCAVAASELLRRTA